VKKLIILLSSSHQIKYLIKASKQNMGIDKFFTSLTRSKLINTCKIKKQKMQLTDGIQSDQSDEPIDQMVEDRENMIECDRLYIDFNSILHIIYNDIERDIQYVMYSKIIGAIDKKCEDIMNRIDQNFDLMDNMNGQIEEWLSGFKNHIVSLIDENYVLMYVKNYIRYIMTNLVTGDTVRRIFISIDGVPNMAKIVEQKKRRILSSINAGLKKKIEEQFKFSMSNSRQIFENNVYTFDRTKITSGNDFIDVVENYLNSEKFQNDMKQQYPALENIVVSSHNVSGEGEKKIMEDIISTYGSNDDKYVIFSPDSDIIILSILIRNILNRRTTLQLENMQNNSIKSTKLKTKTFSKVGLIRYNPHDDQYDYISADNLCNEIFCYIQKKTQLELDEDRVTNDICFLFTLFGNDFIPKMEAIDIGSNIEVILDTYIRVLEISHKARHFGMYIVYHNGTKYRINYASFSKYIENMASIETALLKDRYMAHTYKNFNNLKKIFGESMLYPHLLQYLQFANIIYSVRSSKCQKTGIDDMVRYVRSEINNTFKNDQQSLEIIIKKNTSKFIRIERINLMNASEKTEQTVKANNDRLYRLIEIITNDPNINPKLFLAVDHKNIKEFYHQQRIKSLLPHPQMSITRYDEEMYMMSKCICHYKQMMCPKYEIGFFDLVATRRYKYECSYALIDAKEYYQRYFDINISNDNQDNNANQTDTTKINKIITEYIKGLFWVFNHYMNCNDNHFNKDNINTWSYQYSHAPLMFHISKHISNLHYANRDRKNKWEWMENIYKSVCEDNYVHRDNFMTKREYTLYTSPHQKLYDVTENNNTQYDIDLIVDRIWNGDPDVIDVRYSFLSKGKLVRIKSYSYDEWKKLSDEKNVIKNYNDRRLLISDETIGTTTKILVRSPKKTAEHLTERPADRPADHQADHLNDRISGLIIVNSGSK
jgi:5'-3' exonuclease